MYAFIATSSTFNILDDDLKVIGIALLEISGLLILAFTGVAIFIAALICVRLYRIKKHNIKTQPVVEVKSSPPSYQVAIKMEAPSQPPPYSA